MKQLQLNFLQRVRLVDVLGTTHGPLKVIAPIWDFIKSIRLTDEEQTAVNFTIDGAVRRWEALPNESFGNLTHEFKHSYDAATVLHTLEHYPDFEPVDMVWLQDVLTQLQ
jgi:hypothetical protein